MVEVFRAIGFEIPDDAAYNSLAELAEAQGERTSIQRRGATLHGRCWRLGDGLEVWTILYESDGGLYYADCRPAFRPRYAQAIHGWELVEYDEDGEAVVEGHLARGDSHVAFELQNLTELPSETFTHSQLSVTLAGLAYSVQLAPEGAGPSIRPSDQALAVPPPDGSDHVVVGKVVREQHFRNAQTGASLSWFHLDAGGVPMEVVADRSSLDDEVAAGDLIEAEVWLQGYVLTDEALRARYEGVDPEWGLVDAWSLLRREN